jgi:hypothetical protein
MIIKHINKLVKMKHFFFKLTSLVIFGCFLLPNFAKSQLNEFEGCVEYSCQFKSISNQYSTKSLKDYYGDTLIVFIKGGNYKQVYKTSKGLNEAYFDYLTNRYYFLLHGIDTIYYFDAGLTNDLYKVKSFQTANKLILGYHCQCVLLTSSTDSCFYYYTPDLPLSEKYFVNHKYGGYNILTQSIKSIYLAQLSKYRYYIYTSKAYNIENKKLEDSIFKMPNYPLKKF